MVDSVYAFLAIDHEEEGIPAFQNGSLLLPMIGADKERVDSMRSIAQDIVKRSGKRIELVRFTQREHLDWIEP